MSIKDEKITFKTQIEFKGPIAEFEKVADALIKLPISIRIEWPPGHLAGCWPIPPERILGRKVLNKVIEGMPRIKIIQPFPGGIRNAHLHIKDEIVLLDRARFREVVGQIAMELAGKLAERAEYTETVGAIRDLVSRAK